MASSRKRPRLEPASGSASNPEIRMYVELGYMEISNLYFEKINGDNNLLFYQHYDSTT